MKLTKKQADYLQAEKELRHAILMKRSWEREVYHATKVRDKALAAAFGDTKAGAFLAAHK